MRAPNPLTQQTRHSRILDSLLAARAEVQNTRLVTIADLTRRSRSLAYLLTLCSQLAPPSHIYRSDQRNGIVQHNRRS
jgi:hypothetical protein